ncbi:hypothetical protein HYDPIDRAFT_88868 [Hydnomerulius pinastri MD-312]|uniref:SHSP domain-containing protein n=1 Tax=Hydnomerulius pinastri MD-312 TaxID=994086 RepID=A0A0C9WGB2_9AGAM|nr:hypothetical protein HYDPIDRAFT_88868 [Hydnomerulius pinastri MD-312]
MRFYYDPLTEFDRLFDDAFSSRFRPSSTVTEIGRGIEGGAATFRPRMDLHENSENNIITATFDLPGMKREDVTVDVHHDHLIISGEINVSQKRDEGGYAVRERSCGKFSRTLALPPGTKHEEVKAKMENGVLTVTFPKAQQQQPQRIAIA